MKKRKNVASRNAVRNRSTGQLSRESEVVNDDARWVTTTRVYPATRAETARLGSSIVNGAYLSGRRLSKCREGSHPDASRRTRSGGFHHELWTWDQPRRTRRR